MALTFKQALQHFWQQISLQFVRKENGKGLSTNDFTTAEKNKLAGIAANATANTGTITGVTAGNGLTGGGTSGSVTLNIAADRGLDITNDKVGHTNSITADTAKGDNTKTLTFGGTFTIPSVTYDAQGHITAKGSTTMTMPANPNIDTGATDVEVTGNGNAVTSATYNAINRKLTLTKGATYNNYTHPAGNAASKTSGFYKFATDANSHISSVAAVSKSDITGLGLNASDVNAVPTTRTVNNKALSSDITLSASDVSAIPASMKGAINGVAELDSTGKIPTSQLPAYVDDVLEYTTKNSFPLMGETGKIYVDLTTSLAWRWGGSAYVEISPSLALGETSSTAYRGDRGKIAYDHAQAKGIEKVNGFYKITTNSEGHITAANAVAQSDIVALGMATQDYVSTQIQEAVKNFITQAQMEAYVETSILGGEW